jgi:hypothetical protein
MRFAATRRWKNYRGSSHEEKKNSAVGPARSKGKLLSTYTQKTDSAQMVIVSAVCAPVACSSISSIPASFTFSQQLPARPVSPGHRAAPRRRCAPPCRRPRTAPTIAASSYHRLRPVPSGTRTARCRLCGFPPPQLAQVPPPPPVTRTPDTRSPARSTSPPPPPP